MTNASPEVVPFSSSLRHRVRAVLVRAPEVQDARFQPGPAGAMPLAAIDHANGLLKSGLKPAQVKYLAELHPVAGAAALPGAPRAVGETTAVPLTLAAAMSDLGDSDLPAPVRRFGDGPIEVQPKPATFMQATAERSETSLTPAAREARADYLTSTLAPRAVSRSWSDESVDAAGAERAQRDEETCARLGLALPPAFFALGTTLVDVGVDNARKSRESFEALPRATEACAALEAEVVAEDRRSIPVGLSDLRVTPRGELTRGADPLTEREGFICGVEEDAMQRLQADLRAKLGAGGDLGAEGISHALMAERYALPGELIVGTDSHTPHSGALGCVAFGVGTTDMANAFMTGAVRAGAPEVLRIEVDGALAPGVSAKDLVLHLLALPAIRAGAGVGRVFEFGGAAVRALDIDERATLTNMVAELGGFTGLVEPDEVTVQFLRERRGIDFRIEPWMRSDEGAPYAEVMRIDASALSTMVTRPGDPGLGLPLRDLAERPRLDIAYGGSCTAGKREDFAQYHAVLDWALRHGQRVAPGVALYLQFGTEDVRRHCEAQGWLPTFEAVGAQLLQPACGACMNCGPGASTDAAQVTVSAVNRNFPGRNGPGQVWLASPATVAASAIAGRLLSFDELRARPPVAAV